MRSLREKTLMAMMADAGMTRAAIGRRFGITAPAVLNHLRQLERLQALPDGIGFLSLGARRILEQLGVKCRADAAAVSEERWEEIKSSLSFYRRHAIKEARAWACQADLPPDPVKNAEPSFEDLSARTKNALLCRGLKTHADVLAVGDRLRFAQNIGVKTIAEIEAWLGQKLPHRERWDGVPDSPHVSGYHYIGSFHTQNWSVEPWYWDAGLRMWQGIGWARPRKPATFEGDRYAGPVPEAPAIYHRKGGA
jgi:hypothetical protein